MIRIATWLYVLLFPVAFLGSCALTARPIMDWKERAHIHPVVEKEFFPVLVRSADGKFSIAKLGSLPDGTQIITSVRREEEPKINRDLCDSIGLKNDYRYFQVLAEEGGMVHVSLEVPTTHDSKTNVWYSLKNGSLTPERIVDLGPGFAFECLPWNFGAGILGAVLYLTFVGRKKKPLEGTR